MSVPKWPVAVIAMAGVISTTASSPPTAAEVAPPSRTIGLVATLWQESMVDSPNCPEGLNLSPSEIVLQGKSPAETAYLTSAAGTNDLRRLAMRTPDGEQSICLNPGRFEAPPLRVVQGSQPVPGLDLDGRGTTARDQGSSCGHVNFAGPNGRQTIDNQLLRLNGCIRGRRLGGISQQSTRAELINGSYAILIEISGVDSRTDDPDVDVALYSSQDHTPFVGAGKPLPNGSMTVHPDKKFHAFTKGRIVQGVLRTDPIDAKLDFPAAGQKMEYDLRQLRLELALSQDGSAKGLLAGYMPLESYYFNQITIGGHRFFGDGAAEAVGFSCSAMHVALAKYADGLRNAETGQCEGISAAYMVEALPAFIIKDGPQPADTLGPLQ